MNNKWTLVFILTILITPSCFSQSDATEKAIENLRSKSYWKSIRELYLSYKDLTGIDEKSETLAQLGLAYLHTQNYIKANYFFNAALSKKKSAIWHTSYIKSLIASDELREAKKQLEISRDLYEDAKGELEKLEESIALHKKWKNGIQFYRIKHLPNLNSPESDFSPLLLDQTLYFTSMRNNVMGNQLDLRTGHSFSDIFQSHIFLLEENSLMKGTFSTPLPTTDANTAQHEGTPSFCIEKQKMFYSQCKKTKRNRILCNIYQADLKEGKWVNHKALFTADTNTVYSHPCISKEGGTLYFTSNLLDKDNLDLYYTSLNEFSGKWSPPKRLGDHINTSGSECFPSLDGEGNLYFSSDGLSGMGGLDIFKAEKVGYSFAKPENMKHPINSGADDFGITWNQNHSEGFFSSDRLGGLGSDDLYAFSEISYQIILQGNVEEKGYGIPLENVIISLYGSDGSAYKSTTDLTGKYQVRGLKSGLSYKVHISLPKYLKKSLDFSTIGISNSQYKFEKDRFLYTAVLDIKMDRIINPILIKNIRYDFNKATLKPSSKKSLDKLKELMEENPKIVIQLRSHTDHIGTAEDNIDLSKRRAASCVSYLQKIGIDNIRLQPLGLGENEPYVVPYKSNTPFEGNTRLTEKFIFTLSQEENEIARALNRRTDFKVVGVLDFSTDKFGKQKVKIVPTRREDFYINPTLFYTLSVKDNYGTVARRFGLSVKQLKNLNGGLVGIRPFKGLTLKVKRNADYKDFDAKHRRISNRENSLSRISKKLGLSVDSIKKINRLLKEEDLRGGVLVKIR